MALQLQHGGRLLRARLLFFECISDYVAVGAGVGGDRHPPWERLVCPPPLGARAPHGLFSPCPCTSSRPAPLWFFRFGGVFACCLWGGGWGVLSGFCLVLWSGGGGPSGVGDLQPPPPAHPVT